MKGHFAVQKASNSFFSNVIWPVSWTAKWLHKGDGGAVGLTENPQALERWMIIGPELSRHIQEFEKWSQKLGPT